MGKLQSKIIVVVAVVKEIEEIGPTFGSIAAAVHADANFQAARPFCFYEAHNHSVVRELLVL